MSLQAAKAKQQAMINQEAAMASIKNTLSGAPLNGKDFSDMDDDDEDDEEQVQALCQLSCMPDIILGTSFLDKSRQMITRQRSCVACNGL